MLGEPFHGIHHPEHADDALHLVEISQLCFERCQQTKGGLTGGFVSFLDGPIASYFSADLLA
jgi:hypothetical protein